MLYNKDFLLKLDNYPHRVVYARITALNFQESPIEYIEGRVTQGSVNLDGSSAVRRTCSLTIAAQDFNFNEYYWGLNTKFKLEVGLENCVDSTYPDIIWFSQGIFLITSFSTSKSINSFNITIQGKDKMCLLNGEIGGSLESSVDFGTIQEEDINGNWSIRQVPIPEIIRNLIHNYAGEPYNNIIINDLDTYGLELLEYRYEQDLYLFREVNSAIYDGGILDDNKICFIYSLDDTCLTESGILLKELTADHLESLTEALQGDPLNYKIRFEKDIEEKAYLLTKVEYGQTAGYRLTDLVYAGELIANVGESLTSVLDKIKNMLVEFEYFYNLDGQFVFQKKRSFKETIWQFGNEEASENVLTQTAVSSNYAYEFHGSNLITAFNNNPNLLNMRNDYSVWGERTGLSGAVIPVHLRYAIDTKPSQYTSIIVTQDEVEKYNNTYGTLLEPQLSHTTYYASDIYSIEDGGAKVYCDWREIVYQMAKDYYRYNFLDDFEWRVANANPGIYWTGRTGYEQYYIDLYSFWRDLYYPDLLADTQAQTDKKATLFADKETLTNLLYGSTGIEVDLKLLQSGKISTDPMDLNNFSAMSERYKNIYGIKDDNGNAFTDIPLLAKQIEILFEQKKSELNLIEYDYERTEQQEQILIKKQDMYYLDEELYHAHRKYWNIDVYEAPSNLNFWFDFLDTSGELQQFNVKLVGSRSKAINDKDVKSIYFRDTPPIIYYRSNESKPSDITESGYRYIQVPDYDHMFSISTQGKSAKNKLDELIYQHGYCIESATITTIPIYYLEPNTRIYVNDKDTGIDGDYIVSKITVPLTHNGTMSITATKAAERLL